MILKRGESSTNVAIWQGFLNRLGYRNVIADAVFGPNTEAATRSFQNAQQLRADGMVGEATIDAARRQGFGGFPTSNVVEKKATPVPTIAVPDQKGLGKLSLVHPTLAKKVTALVNMAADEGFTLRIVQGLRTFAEQDALYAQGRTRKGVKVTNARGGESWHNLGLAVDLAFVVDREISWQDSLYGKIGQWAKNSGLDWGGNWKHKDLPHVQLPDLANKPSASILTIYKTGGIASVWERF
ncbi:MAG: D-alanyl-D-alanine carboxypeptidase family protein [Acidobacteriota bacterium]